jgi:hypothetical protein
MSIEKFSELIVNRTRDLQACSIVPTFRSRANTARARSKGIQVIRSKYMQKVIFSYNKQVTPGQQSRVASVKSNEDTLTLYPEKTEKKESIISPYI